MLYSSLLYIYCGRTTAPSTAFVRLRPLVISTKLPAYSRIPLAANLPRPLHPVHAQDPQYRNSLAVRPYTLADLARHLRTAMPPGWDHPLSTHAPQPPSARMAAHGAGGPAVLGLGRPWGGGRDHRSDGPGGRWLWQLWGLVNNLLDAATTWQVRPPSISKDLTTY